MHFSADFISAEVRAGVKKLLETKYSDFRPQYDEEVDDYITWNIARFQSYHITHSGSKPFIKEKWITMFQGWMRNAFDKEDAVKSFRHVKFDPKLITEYEPFKSMIREYDETTISLIHQILAIFNITYPEDRMPPSAWQRKAWSWLVNDRSLHERRIHLPDVSVKIKGDF